MRAEVSPFVSYAFDRFRFMLTTPLHIEDNRPNYALAHEADEAISRVFGSPEHDEAMATLEEVQRVREAGADSLELLQTLARTSAIAKWAALCERLNDTAAMVSQSLPEGGRGDGSKYASHVGTDSYFLSADGMTSRFRHEETQTLDTEPCYPGDVAARLCQLSVGVLRWLKDEQQRCGRQVPLIKHDRFMRLCHSVTVGDDAPAHLLALPPMPETGRRRDSNGNGLNAELYRDPPR